MRKEQCAYRIFQDFWVFNLSVSLLSLNCSRKGDPTYSKIVLDKKCPIISGAGEGGQGCNKRLTGKIQCSRKLITV